MMVAIRSEPEASAELEEGARWYEQQRAGLGMEFIAAIDVALERIAQWPKAGQHIAGVPDNISVRGAPVNRFPYHVVYMEWGGVIRHTTVADPDTGSVDSTPKPS